MGEQRQTFEVWAIVELMGHQRMAGWVTEATIAGGSFIRIDVPDTAARPAYTRYIGPPAIFAINPTTEQIARAMAERYNPAPVNAYEMPQLTGGSDRSAIVDSDDDYPEDDREF